MVKKLATIPPGTTQFQLHKSQLQISHGFPKAIILDFTEHKLLALVRQSRDNERKLLLLDLLAKYRAGTVAVAWENGNKPVYISVTKST